jgi:NAD-dependent dihydropyrimidine dehydrogenase PreA subunit
MHIITRKCTLCKACLDLCPTKSIFMGEGQLVIDADTCDDSAICVSVCPESAIQPVIDKAKKEAEEAALAAAASGAHGAHGTQGGHGAQATGTAPAAKKPVPAK